jgi:hypothetical protein
MTKSDSLDHITLDSYEIKNIENFEKNYYNHKNNIIQKGGNNKLEKNILRLYNCFILSKNQNGGNDNLSLQIKKRLANNLRGGIIKEEDIISSNNGQITNMLIAYIKKILSDEEIKTNITTLLNNKEIYSNIKIISDWLKEDNNKPIIIFIIDNIIDNITNMLISYLEDKSNIDKIISIILSMLDNESNINNIKYISENILPYITDIIKKINPDKILLDALGNNVNKGITDFSIGAVDVATNVFTGLGDFFKKQALIPQKGGNNNKLEKNILRLYNCYILSQNQNGGNNNLSLQIKKRLDKKINNLIGGENLNSSNNGQITNMLIALIKKNLSYEEIKTNITKLLNNKEIYSNIQIISNWLVEDNNKKKIKDFIIPIIIFIIDNITNMLKSYIVDASNIEKIISMLDNKSNIDNIKYIIRKHILPYITDIIKKINPDKILYDALFSTGAEGVASYSMDGLRHIIKQILKPFYKENKRDSDNNSSQIINYYNTQAILDNAATKILDNAATKK